MDRLFHRYEILNHRSIVPVLWRATIRIPEYRLSTFVTEVGTMPYVNRHRHASRCMRAALGSNAAKGGCLFLHAWYAFVPHSRSPVCSVGNIHAQPEANHAATNTYMRYAGIASWHPRRDAGMHDDRHIRRERPPDRRMQHRRRRRRLAPCGLLHDRQEPACHPAQVAVTSIGGSTGSYPSVVFNLAEGICTSSQARAHWFR